MPNPYSGLKAFRHPDIMQGLWDKRPTRPSHVELILFDLCNQNCKFCAYRMEGYTSNQLFNEKNMISMSKAQEIIRDCKDMGVGAIQFTGGGEPTIHPFFDHLAGLTWAIGLKFSLVTNGVRIATHHLEKTVAKAAWVRVSLDAATEETYTTMRRCPKWHFGKAKEAVQLIAKEKKDCVLGVGFVVNPQNWKEVVDAAKLAKELGADNFRISAQFSNEDEKLFEPFAAEAERLCREAERLSDISFHVFNRFPARLSDLSAHKPVDRLCGYQFFTTYIGADLNVYRCCGYAYNERGLVGSLKDKSFKDLWMSQERFDGQYNFDGRGCERCQFRHINAPLAYVMEKAPQLHEEFV